MIVKDQTCQYNRKCHYKYLHHKYIVHCGSLGTESNPFRCNSWQHWIAWDCHKHVWIFVNHWNNHLSVRILGFLPPGCKPDSMKYIFPQTDISRKSIRDRDIEEVDWKLKLITKWIYEIEFLVYSNLIKSTLLSTCESCPKLHKWLKNIFWAKLKIYGTLKIVF